MKNLAIILSILFILTIIGLKNMYSSTNENKQITETKNIKK